VSTNVSKPEKHGSGRTAVIDYLITTAFPDEKKSSETNESLVRRTFEDFHWLQERLVKERMGIIVPVLSKKKPAKNKDQFFEPFIRMRQESLDRFLQRVIQHPELVDSPCLLPFFTANPTDWAATKETANANSEADKDLLMKENTTNPDGDELASGVDTIHIDANAAMDGPNSPEKKKKGPMRRWFANKRTAWALKKDNLDLDETPAEAKKFADLKTYADHLEVCVRILSEDYKEICASNTVLADKTGTMGAAFAQMWGEHELSNTSSSNLYQSIGKVWANSSNRIEDQVAFGQQHFENPVDDLLMDVSALQDALAKRKAALYAYTQLSQLGRNLSKQLERIKQGGNLESERYFRVESELRHCDDQIAESRNHSDLVTTRLERDVERFRVEWHERMRQVLETFHKIQVNFFETQAKDFSSVLPALAALDSKRSDLAVTAPKAEAMAINFSVTSSGAKASVVGGGEDPAVPSPPEAVSPPEVSPPAEAPLVAESSSGENDGLQAISLNASFGSEDGFGAVPTMGGGGDEAPPASPTDDGDEEDASEKSKPIVKSV